MYEANITMFYEPSSLQLGWIGLVLELSKGILLFLYIPNIEHEQEKYDNNKICKSWKYSLDNSAKNIYIKFFVYLPLQHCWGLF